MDELLEEIETLRLKVAALLSIHTKDCSTCASGQLCLIQIRCENAVGHLRLLGETVRAVKSSA